MGFRLHRIADLLSFVILETPSVVQCGNNKVQQLILLFFHIDITRFQFVARIIIYVRER